MASARSEEIKAKIQEYLIQHPDATLREIGDFLGVSRQRVHVLLRGMNLEIQRQPKKQTLTYHQLEILRYIARGYTTKQIAEAMGCGAQSISNRLQAIYAKLDVHKRKHAVRLAIKQGIILPNDCKRPEG